MTKTRKRKWIRHDLGFVGYIKIYQIKTPRYGTLFVAAISKGNEPDCAFGEASHTKKEAELAVVKFLKHYNKVAICNN